ncbi:unnamed protein product, partial [marine sediment metagenome]
MAEQRRQILKLSSGDSSPQHTIKDGVRVPDSELDDRTAKTVAALRFLNDEVPLPTITEQRRQILDELAQDLEQKRQQDNQAPSLLTGEVIAGFLESKDGKVADKSLESYRHTLKPFAEKYP